MRHGRAQRRRYGGGDLRHGGISDNGSGQPADHGNRRSESLHQGGILFDEIRHRAEHTRQGVSRSTDHRRERVADRGLDVIHGVVHHGELCFRGLVHDRRFRVQRGVLIPCAVRLGDRSSEQSFGVGKAQNGLLLAHVVDPQIIQDHDGALAVALDVVQAGDEFLHGSGSVFAPALLELVGAHSGNRCEVLELFACLRRLVQGGDQLTHRRGARLCFDAQGADRRGDGHDIGRTESGDGCSCGHALAHLDNLARGRGRGVAQFGNGGAEPFVVIHARHIGELRKHGGRFVCGQVRCGGQFRHDLGELLDLALFDAQLTGGGCDLRQFFGRDRDLCAQVLEVFAQLGDEAVRTAHGTLDRCHAAFKGDGGFCALLEGVCDIPEDLHRANGGNQLHDALCRVPGGFRQCFLLVPQAFDLLRRLFALVFEVVQVDALFLQCFAGGLQLFLQPFLLRLQVIDGLGFRQHGVLFLICRVLVAFNRGLHVFKLLLVELQLFPGLFQCLLRLLVTGNVALFFVQFVNGGLQALDAAGGAFERAPERTLHLRADLKCHLVLFAHAPSPHF